MAIAEGADALEKFRFGGDHAHIADDRFQDERGRRTGRRLERVLDRCEMIESRDPRVSRDRRRDAGRIGNAERLKARASLDEKTVRVAVIAAVQLHDVVASRRRARDTDRGHGRLGPRGHEAQPLRGGVEPAYALPQLDLERARHAEEGALAKLALHGFHDGRMGMAQEHRTPAQHVVQKLVPVGVGERHPAARDDVARRSADRPERTHRGIHSAGKESERALVEAPARSGLGEGARLLHDFFLPRSGAISSAK